MAMAPAAPAACLEADLRSCPVDVAMSDEALDAVHAPQRRTGRDEQVAELFDQHYSGLCRLASLLLGDRAAAEEAVQEAFVRTYTGWWRIRHPERAQWYLRRAVVNQCRSRQRRRQTEDRGNRIVFHSEASGQMVDPADALDALTIAAAVRSQPPRQREAVVLRYFDDLPEAEIASLLGCSVGTVKSQLSKARATLASLLGDLRPEVQCDE
jgi:RNA polymerase sigma-70 factor (sigma-E family)